MIETRFSKGDIDVLIIAEGTYPFVRGGVASWLSDMVHGLKEYNFGIIFLGAYEGSYQNYVYPIPDNVVHLQLVYLFGGLETQKTCPVHADALAKVDALHHNLQTSHGHKPGLIYPLNNLNLLMCPESGFDYSQFLHSEEAWSLITKKYNQFSSSPSFLNYFWNIRNMHEPLWALHEALKLAPTAKIIHSTSTGYAGLLATMLIQQNNTPLILTEHGLYSKERTIELLQSSMFAEVDSLLVDKKLFSYEHQLWLNFYDSLARMCYQEAGKITSLYQGARKQQIAAGAAEAKTEVIANGIDIKNFAELRRGADAEIPMVVCFVGRVARIKDIMTFIRSIQLMVKRDNRVQGWIKSVGEPDPEYLQECIEYIDFLGISEYIHFIVEGGMKEILCQIGILVLSSISEGMPLVLLESMAAGIPVIATDVGACREIIEGGDDQDRALGSCGAVVTIADAAIIAEEALSLLQNPQKWHSASEVAIIRVETYYNQKLMFERYTALYQEALLWQA